MTDAELRAIHQAYVDAQSKADKLQAARLKAFQRFVASGRTKADIARATGLTPARVGQLLNR